MTGTVQARSEIITIPETARYQTCLTHDNCLLPSELTICEGARVTWISDNFGSISLQSGHVVKEKDGWSGIGTDDFAANHVPGNQGFTHRFEQNGTYDYFLIPHMYAHGKITVIEHCELPPLKQYESGIPYHDIQCKDGFELVAKSTNGFPACVKEQSVEKLVKRWWAISDRTYDLVNPQTYVIAQNEKTFEILYSIDGATLSEIIHDDDSNSIIISLDDSVGGSLVMSIPRDLIDAKLSNDGKDDVFFVLINGREVLYGEISDENERILTILLPQDANLIEIIGTYWI